MATAGVPLWSTTAATNASADPAVNWAEGMAPSAVNDSARAMMASVAKWRNDLSGITTGGSSTAYTVTTGSTFAAAADMSGMIFAVIPHATSGASPTLAVDGLTARAINESTGVAVATGALILGTPYLVKYVHASTEFILLGRSPVFNTLTAKTNIIAAPGTTAGRPSAVSGGFRFNTDTGLPEFSDGANWFSLITTLAGAQMPYGAVINGTIAESHTSNAVTFALKTLAGTDPSASDPVLIGFRNSTVATGNYVYKTVTAALSLVISSGSTMGFSSGVAGKLWLVLFNDAGTVRMGAINNVSGSNVYPLGQMPIASSTAEGGLGAADSAQVFYTGTAVTSMPYVLLGYASYETGVATAGSWAASPTRLELFGAGVPLPGQKFQVVRTSTGAFASGSTALPFDDTIPQNTEGDQYLSQAITPTSASNILEVAAALNISVATQKYLTTALFQDSTANALVATANNAPGTSIPFQQTLNHRLLAGTTSATTFKVRSGPDTAATITVNGIAGARSLGGVYNSWLEITEIMT